MLGLGQVRVEGGRNVLGSRAYLMIVCTPRMGPVLSMVLGRSGDGVSRRPVGPDGKVKKREYFWKCEVGGGGRNLQQSRICFVKKPDGGNNDTLGYQM